MGHYIDLFCYYMSYKLLFNIYLYIQNVLNCVKIELPINIGSSDIVDVSFIYLNDKLERLHVAHVVRRTINRDVFGKARRHHMRITS